ncbi:biotin--[acetyl-CoA-carboxylase] ligase [Spirosoma luteolum]
MYKIYPKTLFAGQITYYLPSCQSTNDEAANLIARDDAAEGLVIITDQQTAGRGQRGNVWEAQPAQNLTCSLVLRPSFLRASEQFWLNMAVSLGIHDTLRPLLGDVAPLLRVKWPNDVYVDTQKMGGILIENTLQGQQIAWSIVGMGLNINQMAFGYTTATSLQQQAPLPDGYNLPGLLSQLCEKLEARYLQLRSGQRDSLRTDYLQTLYRFGEEHLFEADGKPFYGTITGVDEMGRLAIDHQGTTRLFGFKEVVFLAQ